MATNTLKFGTETPSKLYMGANEVTKAYMGETLVYEKSSSSGETWVFNTFLTNENFSITDIVFTNSGNTYNEIRRLYLEGRFSANEMNFNSTKVYDHSGWLISDRTITFETAPTGDLLTWLQANAVKQ